MPLMQSKSKKAFEHNMKSEMEAGKPKKQSLAIAYSIKRKPKKMWGGGSTDPKPTPSPDTSTDKGLASIRKAFGGKAHGGMLKRKKYADGGKIPMSAQDERLEDQVADAMTPEEMDMLKHQYARGGEVPASAIDESMEDVDDMYKSESQDMIKRRAAPSGLPKNWQEESMTGIDDAYTPEEMDMMRKKFSDGGELNPSLAMSRKVPGDDVEMQPKDHGMELYEREDEDDIMGRMPPSGYGKQPPAAYDESPSEAIMRKRKYADGGEVDLAWNAREDFNNEDQMSFNALRKENYSETPGLDQLDSPRDSNLHGHELPDEDEYDMADSIRKKIKYRRE